VVFFCVSVTPCESVNTVCVRLSLRLRLVLDFACASAASVSGASGNGVGFGEENRLPITYLL
jgi:hypothetical protein